jgi:RHS repeat-associated protein
LKKYTTVDWAYVTPHQNWQGEWNHGSTSTGALCLSPGATCPSWQGDRQVADGGAAGALPPQYTMWWGDLLQGASTSSGLQYLRNRYFDAATGRFTQPDPIGLAGGVNLYGFAAGDPVNFSDPFGLRDCKGKRDPTCSGAIVSTAFDPVAFVAGGIAGGLRVLGTRLFGRSATSALADAIAVSAGEAGATFSASVLADEVAGATGGVVSRLAKSEGYKVTVEVGRRAAVARIKSSGGFWVSIEGLGSLTEEGVLSSDRQLTHLSGATKEEVTRLLQKAVELIRAARK